MSVIKVKCSDQTLTATEAPLIAAGGTDENYVEFDFDGSWVGFAKIAVFYNKPNKKYATLIDYYGICSIPSEVTRTKGYMYFGVVATNGEGITRTSEMVRYYIEEGAIEIEARPSNHTWEQILANMIKPIVGTEAPLEKDLPSLWFNTGEVQGTKTDGYLTFVDNDGNKIVFYPNTRLENVDGAEDLLKTVAQQLTDAQKTQARGNIGAAASSHSHTKSEITDFPTSLPASDVSAWAKAATKPAYTASEVGAAPQIKKVSISLPAVGWSGEGPFSQGVTLSDITENSKVDLQPDSEVLNQLISDGVSALYVQNDSGTLTAYAIGAKPTAALTIQATVTEVAG